MSSRLSDMNDAAMKAIVKPKKGRKGPHPLSCLPRILVFVIILTSLKV
ncbi:hypothetical protein [Paenibacillus sp. cl141a]|nr:hypothetical protein [Paenibacillus sp. cl141a]